MNDKYDVVVAGAGCAGSVFSVRMASRGFRVLLIDRKRADELGTDAVDFLESEAFELSSIDPPVPPEARPPIKGMDVLSPDTTTRIPITDHQYTKVDRKLFAQRLHNLAKQSGVEVMTQCIVGGAEIDNGFVVSVNTDRGDFPCRLAVGASGLDRVLCRDIPRGMGIPRRLRTRDFISVYRETRELDPDATENGFERGKVEYYMGRHGGFSWVHADEEGTIDVGTAVQDIPGAPDPREIVLGFIRSNPGVGERVLRRGGGRIPTRRPLNTMVASGLMVMGDAACQATPFLGRGVGGAMTGAALAADAAAFALEAGDVSVAGLWSYNYHFMLERGAHMAALDCMRIFLQRMPEKEFTSSLSRGVIDEREMASALSGKFEIPTAQVKIKSVLKGFRDVPLLVRFGSALKLAVRAFELYGQYPREYDPPEYADWAQEADYIFEDVEKP